jgi:ketosteroid isomerase-like protein
MVSTNPSASRACALESNAREKDYRRHRDGGGARQQRDRTRVMPSAHKANASCGPPPAAGEATREERAPGTALASPVFRGTLGVRVSDSDIELIRLGMDHFQRTGEPLWEGVDAECEIHDHDIPERGVYRGHDGWRDWIAEYGEAWESFSLEPQEYIDAGKGRVVQVARLSARGRGSGVSLERLDGIVWTVRDGKVVRLDYYNSPAEALEAVGLTPGAQRSRGSSPSRA